MHLSVEQEPAFECAFEFSAGVDRYLAAGSVGYRHHDFESFDTSLVKGELGETQRCLGRKAVTCCGTAQPIAQIGDRVLINLINAATAKQGVVSVKDTERVLIARFPLFFAMIQPT